MQAQQEWEIWLEQYLNGTADERTVQQLKDWTSASKENNQLFLTFVRSYKMTVPAWIKEVSAEQTWPELAERIRQHEAAKTKKNGALIALRWAAAAAVAASFLFFIFRWIEGNRDEYLVYTTTDAPQQITLPDSSHVQLNVRSQIKINKGFGKKNRSVLQEGQAFYDVTKNQQLPFEIHTAHAVTTVVGTSFDLSAYKENPEERLSVVTGIVNYQPANTTVNSTLVRAGNSLVYAYNTPQLTTRAVIANQQLYWTGKLVFENQPLQSIIPALQNYYHVTIAVKNAALLSKSFTGSFENESLQNVLNTICFTLNIKYQQKGNIYQLY